MKKENADIVIEVCRINPPVPEATDTRKGSVLSSRDMS